MYPWNILGIDPTSDERTIQRAYARMLKKYRPDEDPEGFARLVDARRDALAQLAAGIRDETPVPPEPTTSADHPGRETSRGFSSSHSRVTINWQEDDAGAGTPPEPSRFESARGFSSRDLNEASAPPGAYRAARGRAFTVTMARLSQLLHGTDRRRPGPNWEVAAWRAALAGISDFSFSECRSLREFIIREALPLLPEMPSEDVVAKELSEGGGPGPVVVFWEEEFAFASDQAELARICGAPAVLRYVAWLDGTRRLRTLTEQKRSRPPNPLGPWGQQPSRITVSASFYRRAARARTKRRFTYEAPRQSRSKAFAEAMARLLKLLRGPGGAGPTWDVEIWRRSLAELLAAFPERRDAVREFMVSEALPLLPELQSDNAIANDLREGWGPAPVVMLWEEELALAELAPLCEASAMARYLAWVESAQRCAREFGPIHREAAASSAADRSGIEARFRGPGREAGERGEGKEGTNWVGIVVVGTIWMVWIIVTGLVITAAVLAWRNPPDNSNLRNLPSRRAPGLVLPSVLPRSPRLNGGR